MSITKMSGHDDLVDLHSLVRTIPDFPKPGIQFRDLTTLLLDARGFAHAVASMALNAPKQLDLVAGIEARGFIFASAVARELDLGLLLIRKSGKLPGQTIGVDYALEYGTDRVEIHADACVPGQRVLLVDDLIATGGTALAALRLLRHAGATVEAASFLIDLPDLGGADALRQENLAVSSLLSYPGH